VLGGALTVISWRLAFLINVPIGIVIIVIAVLRIGETHHGTLKLDVPRARCSRRSAVLRVLVVSRRDRARGWIDPCDRRGRRVRRCSPFSRGGRRQPLVPFSLFDKPNR